jgi:hypothetical protein
MHVHNVHEREFGSDASAVGALIDSLGGPADSLWPSKLWPPMWLDPGLRVGARGGHGPIRYTVEQYIPGRSVLFRFSAPRGSEGTHRFEVDHRSGRIVLRHVLTMRTKGWALVTWPLVFRPLHDALLEDLLDAAATALGHACRPRRWSGYVRILRALFKARA